MQYPWWAWAAFGALVAVLLALDLYVHRGERGGTRRSAINWSIVWITAGLAFCGVVWVVFGADHAKAYLAAYLIEKSLSLDNLFVFLVIFRSLEIHPAGQKTALTWGILGAVVFRAIFVFAGIAALERWHSVVYVFAGILLYAAYRIARHGPGDQEESKVVGWMTRHLPVSPHVEHSRFFTLHGGRRLVTPLFVAVAAIEVTDIAFAVDSVPAALAVSREPFIVYSSNVFAILGLRALYLVLAHTLHELRYLHYGLAGVLALAGMKMLTADWVDVPPLVSVAAIAVVIGISIVLSLRADRHEPRAEHAGGARELRGRHEERAAE